MAKRTQFALALASLLALAACGGGGGGGGGNTSGFQQTYIASASIGEVLSYTLNTQNLTYQYTITDSAYGLTGQTGSGVLTANADGSYSPSESMSSKIYGVKDGLFMGVISKNFGSGAVTVPVFGISNPITTIAELAGVYNLISSLCAAKSAGTAYCPTDYGTIKINLDGSYVTCVRANISTTPACATTQGTVSHLGSGIWSAVRNGSINQNKVSAYKASDGQKAAFMDFNDPGGYGFGQGALAQQAGLSNAALKSLRQGVWAQNSNRGTGYTATISGDSFSLSDGRAGVVTGDNSPWDGFVAVPNGVGMFVSSGMYVYGEAGTLQPNYYAIGLKIR